jgi:hypothetical protein
VVGELNIDCVIGFLANPDLAWREVNFKAANAADASAMPKSKR